MATSITQSRHSLSLCTYNVPVWIYLGNVFFGFEVSDTSIFTEGYVEPKFLFRQIYEGYTNPDRPAIKQYLEFEECSLGHFNSPGYCINGTYEVTYI